MRQETGTPSMFVPFLAWGLCLLFVRDVAPHASPSYLSGSGNLDQALVVLASGYAVVGALVAIREPRNAVGWLMLVIAISFALQGLVDVYVAEVDRPFATGAAWFSNSIWYLWLYLSTVMLPLLFPDGRLHLDAVAGRVLDRHRGPGLHARRRWCSHRDRSTWSRRPSIPNPTGIEGAEAILSALEVAGNVLVTIGFVLGAASLVVRLRRSQGRRRQQVAWFAYVASPGRHQPAAGHGRGLRRPGRRLGERRGGPRWSAAIGWSQRTVRSITIGIPVGRRRRDPAAPSLRHRPRRQAHPRLRVADR